MPSVKWCGPHWQKPYHRTYVKCRRVIRNQSGWIKYTSLSFTGDFCVPSSQHSFASMQWNEHRGQYLSVVGFWRSAQQWTKLQIPLQTRCCFEPVSSVTVHSSRLVARVCKRCSHSSRNEGRSHSCSFWCILGKKTSSHCWIMSLKKRRHRPVFLCRSYFVKMPPHQKQ